MARRVIHVLHHSPSVIQDAPLPALLARTGWHLETAYQQQRYIPDLDVECWTIERRLDHPVTQDFRGLPHHVFPARSLGYLRELAPSLVRRLSQLPAAEITVFLHGTIGYLPTQLLLRFGPRLRIIAQNHGERPTARMYTPGRNRPVDYWLRRSLEARSLTRAHRILYLNPASREDYLAVGVPDTQLLLSTMGVAVDTFQRDDALRDATRKRLLERPAPLLGFVGRLAKEKRVDLLLRAFTRLPSELQLVVAGDGPERASLERLASELQIAPRVQFLGHIGDPKALQPLYNAFDLLVLPSSQEGMPVVIVEALATGTNVLASDLPGTRMVLADGAYGQLTAADAPELLSRAILEALAAPDAAERRIRRAQDFSWRAVCERHAQLLPRR